MSNSYPTKHASSERLAEVTHLEIISGELIGRERKTASEWPLTGESSAALKIGEYKNCDELLADAWHRRITTLSLSVRGLAFGTQMTTTASELIKKLPALRGVSIIAVGPPDPADASRIISIHKDAQQSSIPLTLDFVLDDQADAFAALSETTTSLAPVLKASRFLRDVGVNVRWLIPLVRGLVFRLEALVSLARDEKLNPIVISTKLPDRMIAEAKYQLTPDEQLFAWDFVTYGLLEENGPSTSAACLAEYRKLAKMLGDSDLCPEDGNETVAVLQANAQEADDGWVLCLERCPTSILSKSAGMNHRQSRLVNRSHTAVADVAGVLFDGCRAMIHWAASMATAPFARPPATADSLPRVLIIGAYGGDHIGDAAILGGVLHRIHERYGTTQAILMSQRPNHTRHLVEMLDVPVGVRVELYEHAQIRNSLRQVDGVVFGGGPLTDIPKQLVRHLYTVARARRNGQPFIVEGIGVGPFVRRPCAFVSRRLLKLAQRVTVRTPDDCQQPAVGGLEPVVAPDPAFDYLETRPVHLNRITAAERCWIDHLVRSAEGRPLIGINIRPIRHLFTDATAGQNPAEYTQFIESRFEERFAEGLRRFDKESSAKPCFVFFPMNAIQFGMSDLRSAYRVQRQLGKGVDFRVWEADASIDGVVELLRRLDMVISMRFHATIFALAQNRPVVGIDYRVGKRDKVAALMDDFGQSSNCTRIDLMSAEWLSDRLSAYSELLHVR